MKTKFSIFLTAIASGLISAMPAQAASMFGTEGIIFFEEDTEVEFEFKQSNGWWRADFGVMKLDTGEKTILLQEYLNADPGSGEANDNLGTPGSAVVEPLASFMFEEDTEYTLFVSSYNKDGGVDTPFYTQYSTTKLNPSFYNNGTGGGVLGGGNFEVGGNDFDSSIDGTIVIGQQRTIFSGDLFNGDSVRIVFEDNTTWGDNDFDDFVVEAQLMSVSTPEPATLAGLGIVAGGMFLSRCKKQK